MQPGLEDDDVLMRIINGASHKLSFQQHELSRIWLFPSVRPWLLALWPRKLRFC